MQTAWGATFVDVLGYAFKRWVDWGIEVDHAIQMVGLLEAHLIRLREATAARMYKDQPLPVQREAADDSGLSPVAQWFANLMKQHNDNDDPDEGTPSPVPTAPHGGGGSDQGAA